MYKKVCLFLKDYRRFLHQTNSLGCLQQPVRQDALPNRLYRIESNVPGLRERRTFSS